MKILSFPVGEDGCSWYRVKQPLMALHDFTEHDTYVIDKVNDDGIKILEAVSQCDVLYSRQGTPIPLVKQEFTNNLELYGKEIGQERKMSAKWVYDIDDNVSMVSPYSNHYEEYGLEEVKHGEGWLWKDGEANFDLERNRARILKHHESMEAADLVTVTTDKLAEYASYYNKNVAVVPNTINFRHWHKLPLKPNKQLRVGWSGGSSHYEDWFSIKEPLNQLMRQYKFTLVSAGHTFEGVIDQDNRHLLESVEWMPFMGHSYRMMCLKLDIAIIPLAELEFNSYKSAIKLCEMSAMGVPSVVANVTPYKEVADKKFSMPYNSPKEFYESLKTLLTRPGLRQSLGAEALKWVKNGFDSQTWAVRHAEVLETLVKG